MLCSQVFTFQQKVRPQMQLSFSLNVFSFSICHCLKKCVCVCVCVCACVHACARACVCVKQDVSKNKNLISSEHVAAAHQKATKLEILEHIGNSLKISPFQEGGLKKKKPWKKMQ